MSIEEHQATKADVVLLPSEEFKKKYLAEARLMRALAWSFAALGVGAIGAGVAIIVVDGNRSRTLENDIGAFNQLDVRTEAQRDALEKRQAEIATLDGVAIGAMIFGAVSIGVGVTLFATGKSPSKYDDAKTTISMQVGLGRIGLSLSY